MASADEPHVQRILQALQERAKELSCLYRVEQWLSDRALPLDELLRGLLEILPSGWQYPAVCQVRLVLDDRVFEADGFEPTPWTQSAYLVVQGTPVGSVEVSYRQPMPRADEGPFLREERKLLDSVAERVAGVVLERRLKSAFRGWEAALSGAPLPERHEWGVVLDFLRGTDPALLLRITRKMINHLSWSGVAEARALLERFASGGGEDEARAGEDNRPLRRAAHPAGIEDADAVFQIAAAQFGEPEVLACLAKWIREERAGFLVRMLENQDTPLGEIVEGIERFRQLGIDEGELSRSIQIGLRVGLVRRLFTEQVDFINVARNVLEIRDFFDLIGKVVMLPRAHGKLGGKSAGLFLAQKIAEKADADAVNAAAAESSSAASAPGRGRGRASKTALPRFKVPRTWYVPSDGILAFIRYNNLDDVLNRKYMEIDQIRQEYPHLVQLFKNSPFPPAMLKGLGQALDELGERPLIVRSSSLLEDRFGAAFSGKYKSLFLGNLGTREERLAALTDAVAEVYASVFGPDPTEYRTERNLLDVHEEMGILIQEVVGTRVGRYVLPAASGVAMSQNEFRWSARIRREDGLIRLVPGLGTRAVDRVADDYPVLLAPGQPGLRVNVTAEETIRYAPRRIDVINLETNSFETVDVDALLQEVGFDYPQLRQIVSRVDGDRILPFTGLDATLEPGAFAVTFDGLIRGPWFVPTLRRLLETLRTRIGAPVEIEFAWDGTDLYLLQCRPQSFGLDLTPAAIPRDLAPEQVLFTAQRYVSNGSVPDLTHLVYVDPEGYSQLPDPQAMREVGRAVGRLNKLLPRRRFALVGPGRWGSRGDIRLGVPVTYSDISNTAAMIEVAQRKGNYVPDLSFGTHFFQDLVESSIRYLPLYPDDPGVVYNAAFLQTAPSVLGELLPELVAPLGSVLRVIDVPRAAGGRVLRLLMNADRDEAIAFLATP